MDLVKRFKTFSPAMQMATTAMVLAVLCAVLFAVYFTLVRKPYDTLFTGMRTNDAATVVAELDKKKVPYRLADHGTTIEVPSNIVDRTRLEVMSQDLPLKGAVGFELFNKSDMGLTEFAQRINYQRALQGELARTIMTMDMVETARIHLSIPEDTIFRDDRRPPKASVTIQTRDGAVLSAAAVLGVQRLVSASVPDLAVAEVVVLDNHGVVVSAGATAVSSHTSAATEEKLAIEQYYAARVRQALDSAFSGEPAKVRVWAEYDPLDVSGQSAAERWSPSARAFPLRVTVFSDRGQNADVQNAEGMEEVRAVAAAAINLQAADTLTFSPLAAWNESELAQPVSAAPLPVGTRPATVAAPMPAPLPAPVSVSTSLLWAAALFAGAVTVALAAVLSGSRRRGSSRRLTAQEKETYAVRLKQLLEDRDADALSRG